MVAGVDLNWRLPDSGVSRDNILPSSHRSPDLDSVDRYADLMR